MLTFIKKNWQSGGKAAESDITDAFLKARLWAVCPWSHTLHGTQLQCWCGRHRMQVCKMEQ